MTLRHWLAIAAVGFLAHLWWSTREAPLDFASLLPPSLVPGGDATRAGLRYTYYEADADPGGSLLSALNAATPIRHDGQIFHGNTRWHVRWNFRWHKSPDGRCRITEATTRLTGTITLPRLGRATRAQAERFERYLAALRVHELGHYRFGEDAAREIARRIRAMPAMADCRALETAANALGHRTLDEFVQRERQYDRSTNHGETQGARLEG